MNCCQKNRLMQPFRIKLQQFFVYSIRLQSHSRFYSIFERKCDTSSQGDIQKMFITALFEAGLVKLWPLGQIWPHPFICVLSMDALTLLQQSWILATKTLRTTKPKIFIIWIFVEKSLPTFRLKYQGTITGHLGVPLLREKLGKI